MAESLVRRIRDHVAGIDIGSEDIFISVPGHPVVQFRTLTPYLQEAVAFLQSQGVTSVAMEATGVYWVAFYEMLEQAGFEICVANARDVKHLPGRKSDVADCQWIAEMHAHGLLRSSFIPPENIRQLRSYVRQRDRLIEESAHQVLLMQKALDLMNVRLHTVISQLTGVSGMRVLRAILSGEHKARRLLALCETSIRKNKEREVLASLKGNYRPEHVFALRQAIETWDFLQKQIAECEAEISAHLTAMTHDLPPPEIPSEEKPSRHHQPDIDDLHGKLTRLSEGKNPASITGMSDTTFLRLTAEVGVKLDAWKSGKHFVSWCTLAPAKHQSGKKGMKRIRQNKNARVGQIFRQMAMSIACSKHNALSSFYRRIAARRGKPVAIKAVARKLAMMFYDVMTKGVHFVEQGIARYEEQYRERYVAYLSKQAKNFGLTVVKLESVH